MNSGKRTIVLAGGSGFLGSALARHFSQSGWQVVIFSRGSADAPKAGGIKHLHWDGKTMGAWAEALNGCDAVINLAGRTVNCRFTAQNRKDILESRVNATKVLGEAISRSGKPPAVWLNCSGVGIYNQSFHRDIDESSKDFSEAQTGTSF